ncbi:hypothetical protein LX32DRAFT_397718 [Colletotrichum zoysiae]|uniref:Uncharacterized protein n=1 Tax=Colletotrichum zoysiae TaxID=1216348 RepID=A0AAD9M9Y5_9PEZI|nr:hypothetical protein LX32DRAFT_397718 [Colletotrichum zoysiae]
MLHDDTEYAACLFFLFLSPSCAPVAGPVPTYKCMGMGEIFFCAMLQTPRAIKIKINGSLTGWESTGYGDDVDPPQSTPKAPSRHTLGDVRMPRIIKSPGWPRGSSMACSCSAAHQPAESSETPPLPTPGLT